MSIDKAKIEMAANVIVETNYFINKKIIVVLIRLEASKLSFGTTKVP